MSQPESPDVTSDTPAATSRSAVPPALILGGGLFLLMLVVCGGGWAVLSRSTVPGTKLVYTVDSEEASAQDVVEPLRRRLVDVGPYGAKVTVIGRDQIEVVLPTVDPRAVDYAKRLISSGGHLRFLILANSLNHQHLLSLAQQPATAGDVSETSPPRNVKNDSGEVVARWVTAARQDPLPDGSRPLYGVIDQALVRNSETGEILILPPNVLAGDTSVTVAGWMDQQGIESIDLLAVVDATVEVNGSDLSFAAMTFDENGQPAVAIHFTDQGSARFFALTVGNAPTLNRYSKLAIVLDDQVLSSPNILGPIRNEARITGRFTRQEVQFIVSVLQSGAMPTEISDQPISEEKLEVPVSVLDRLGF